LFLTNVKYLILKATPGGFIYSIPFSQLFVKYSGNNKWIYHISIKGNNGADGATWHIGEGSPYNSLGKPGDLYLDFKNSDIYSKSDSGWLFLTNIKGQNGNNDKQIRFTVLTKPFIYSTVSSEWDYEYDDRLLIKFNIDHYPGVDSAVFVSLIETEDSISACNLQLFNLTDSLLMPSSIVKTNSIDEIMVESGNCLSEFPHKEIDLSIAIKSDSGGIEVSTTECYLFLYRK